MMNIDLSPLHNLGKGGLPGTELVDGQHVILTCSRCRKQLCDLWIIQPSLDIHTKIVAHCDYCGDKSYEKEIKGKFQLGATNDSGPSDLKHDFLDGKEEGGIYQKMQVFTKRLK